MFAFLSLAVGLPPLGARTRTAARLALATGNNLASGAGAGKTYAPIKMNSPSRLAILVNPKRTNQRA